MAAEDLHQARRRKPTVLAGINLIAAIFLEQFNVS
jgi:hypothetical protein